MKIIAFLPFLITLIRASSIRIPSRYDRNGSPVVNASVVGTLFENGTLPMRVYMGTDIAVGQPAVSVGHVQLVTTNDEGHGRLALMDPRMHFLGARRESLIGIGINSFLRNEYGPVALTRDALVLNTTFEEFVSSCVENTYMAIPLNGTTVPGRWNGTFEIDNISTDVSFQFGGYVGKFLTFPREVYNDILARMSANGAEEYTRAAPGGGREQVLSNCTNPFEGLPDVTIGFNGIGSIVLSPEDYIHQVDDECYLRVRPIRMGECYQVNPLELPGTNMRISDDLLEICDAATA